MKFFWISVFSKFCINKHPSNLFINKIHIPKSKKNWILQKEAINKTTDQQSKIVENNKNLKTYYLLL